MKRHALAGLATLATLALALAAPSGALAHQRAGGGKVGVHKKAGPASISVGVNKSGPKLVLSTQSGKTGFSSSTQVGRKDAAAKKRKAKSNKAHKSHKARKSRRADKRHRARKTHKAHRRHRSRKTHHHRHHRRHRHR